jgi:hypothetical protein
MNIEVLGTDIDGCEFVESAQTMVISRHGAAIALNRQLAPHQPLLIRRQNPGQTHEEGQFREVEQIAGRSSLYAYCVALVNPNLNLWGVEFPPPAEPQEALARMLLGCCHCRGPEVIYLSELVLAVFEAHQGIARYCRTCCAPTIWKQTPQEVPGHLPPPSRETSTKVESIPALPNPSQVERTRQKTRLTACVAESGHGEETVVCENMSRGGLCFRSRRCYAKGSRIEIAVPYCQGAAKIFVPGRVVYAQELPAVRLYRHGVTFQMSSKGEAAN